MKKPYKETLISFKCMLILLLVNEIFPNVKNNIIYLGVTIMSLGITFILAFSCFWIDFLEWADENL